MNKLKKSILSIMAICVLIISTSLPVLSYAQSGNTGIVTVQDKLSPPSTLPTMEKYFGYDCKLTYNDNRNYLNSIVGVKVNATVYNRVDSSYGVWNDTDYYVDSSAGYILIGEQAMTKNINIIIISAEGYEDLIYEINKNRTDISVHQHSGGTADCANYAVCSVCGQNYGELDLNHSFGEWKITKAPRCTRSGEEQRVCSICGTAEKRSVKPLGHKMTVRNSKPATCAQEGYTGYSVCSICGIIIDGTVIPKLDHSYGEWKIISVPSCTATGEKERICTVCDDKEIQSIDATGHQESTENVKEASCTEEGYTGDIICTVCGEILEQGTVIPKLNHAYTDGKCTICGANAPINSEESDDKNNSDPSDKTDNNSDKSTSSSEKTTEKDSDNTENQSKSNTNVMKNSSQKSPSTGNNFNFDLIAVLLISGIIFIGSLAVVSSIIKKKSSIK